MNKKLSRYTFLLPEANGAFLTGAFIYSKNKLMQLIREQKYLDNYEEISTPAFFSVDTFKKTGHIDYFSDNMFSFDKYCLKPMSCPGAALYVKNTSINNQDIFPKKIFEFGNVFRKENSGSCQLLTRCLNFTQDDSHVFCKDFIQAGKEIEKFIVQYVKFYKLLGWNFKIHFSIPEQNSMLFKKNGTYIIDTMNDLLSDLSKKYNFNIQLAEGEGAFYAPKIDFLLDDNTQLSTIQLDYFLCQNLDVKFFTPKKEKFFPIVIHTAMLGSIERFMYFLLEKNHGIFPFWISEIPFVICQVDTKSNFSLYDKLINFFDSKNIKYVIEKKIVLISKKYPLSSIIVIGKEEELENKISIRRFYSQGEDNIDVNLFFHYINDRIKLFRDLFN